MLGEKGRLIPFAQSGFPEDFPFVEREGITEAPARFRDDLLPEELVQRHTVRSTDIDMGRHMNNVAYVRLLEISVGDEVLYKAFIHGLRYPEQGVLKGSEKRVYYRLLGELVGLCRREGSICRMAVRKPDGKTAILAAVRFHEK